jgi:hypothetical protein
MALKLQKEEVARFLALPAGEKLAWGKVVYAVAAARLGLRAFSLQSVSSSFGITLCGDEAAPELCTRPDVMLVAQRVRGVLKRWPSESPCLVGALAAGLLLRRLRPGLFIGVHRTDTRVMAHAWLDVDGGRAPIMLPDDNFEFSVLRRSPVV